MGARENKDLLRRLHDEGFPGNIEAIDRYFTANYVDHSFWKDISGLKTTLRAFRAAFPGAQWKVEDMIAEGEKVAVRMAININSAIGAYKSIGSTTIYRFENGRIAETWGHGDPLF
jgi:predicted ester cyclase